MRQKTDRQAMLYSPRRWQMSQDESCRVNRESQIVSLVTLKKKKTSTCPLFRWEILHMKPSSFFFTPFTLLIIYMCYSFFVWNKSEMSIYNLVLKTFWEQCMCVRLFFKFFENIYIMVLLYLWWNYTYNGNW